MVGHENVKEKLTQHDIQLIVDDAKLYSVDVKNKNEKSILFISFLLPSIYHKVLVPAAKAPYSCIKLTMAMPAVFNLDVGNAMVYAETAKYIYQAKKKEFGIVTGQCNKVECEHGNWQLTHRLFDKNFVEISKVKI